MKSRYQLRGPTLKPLVEICPWQFFYQDRASKSRTCLELLSRVSTTLLEGRKAIIYKGFLFYSIYKNIFSLFTYLFLRMSELNISPFCRHFRSKLSEQKQESGGRLSAWNEATICVINIDQLPSKNHKKGQQH